MSLEPSLFPQPVRAFQTDDLTQQGAFSGTAATQQHHGFSVFNVEIQPIQHAPTIVFDHQVTNRDDGHQSFTVK